MSLIFTVKIFSKLNVIGMRKEVCTYECRLSKTRETWELQKCFDVISLIIWFWFILLWLSSVQARLKANWTGMQTFCELKCHDYRYNFGNVNRICDKRFRFERYYRKMFPLQNSLLSKFAKKVMFRCLPVEKSVSFD